MYRRSLFICILTILLIITICSCTAISETITSEMDTNLSKPQNDDVIKNWYTSPINNNIEEELHSKIPKTIDDMGKTESVIPLPDSFSNEYKEVTSGEDSLCGYDPSIEQVSNRLTTEEITATELSFL